MKIDRSNYEIWLIDWLDGNLSEIQVGEIKLFLDNNPDLRDEFGEQTSFRLKPSDRSFLNKNHLKKSSSNLSSSQFEYLSVAYLENDLSSSQQAELKESTDMDSEKKKTFELIQKIRLTPAASGFKYKKKLIKRTLAMKVIRLSVIGLSAAASIALLIMIYFTIARDLPDEIINTAQNTVADSSLVQPPVNKVQGRIIADEKPAIPGQKSKNPLPEMRKNNPVITQTESTGTMSNDSLFRNNPDHGIPPAKIPVFAEIQLNGGIVNNTLVAYNSVFKIPAYDDERSNFSRFIAKTFREKILRENTSADSPLKGYEIAEAGVTGLNKLFGWEMALSKNNDENGALNSVYFSSKFLKFNAPVKKTVPLP
jgi:hypothetical protein